MLAVRAESFRDPVIARRQQLAAPRASGTVCTQLNLAPAFQHASLPTTAI
jgi:hypothetical protein